MKKTKRSTRTSGASASRSKSKSSNYRTTSRSRSHEHDADDMIYDEEYEDFRPTRSLSRGSRTRSSNAQTSKDDIVKLILLDHAPLKRLIAILKDSELTIRTRRRAFDQFAPLLLVHAHAEQESFYTFLKDENRELRVHGLEGDVEHALAEYMVDEVKMAEDAGVWSARAKVLAELVEHHIEEEESEIIPDFKKEVDIEDRILIGKQYLDLKDHFRREESLTEDEVDAIQEERNRDYRPSNLMQ
ncbi:hemerythrin domain-containing protein [Pseudobdellovibrio sp. HCB154]|uniref:hemerythrin domain-containing protein n=1 Tax=Pseudobdellovibrio sp. HCB154 TaxID=3386277 RepID=UPI0039175801